MGIFVTTNYLRILTTLVIKFDSISKEQSN